MALSVENWNATFPKYPMTVRDKGWVYGVWYVGTSWQKVKLHGQYPPGFLKRAMALFPDAKSTLHAPSGTVNSQFGHLTVDRVMDEVRRPEVVADCVSLPFREESFDLVLSDPPYTAADSLKYGCKPFQMVKFVKEARRVLKVGGHLGILHTYYPLYRRKEFALVGLIAVVTGFCRATRMFSIFEKLA